MNRDTNRENNSTPLGKGCIVFGENFHPEFDGWLWESGKGVWISFIQAKQQGKGHFSKLLEELKSKYEWIKIPTPSNLMLSISQHKGFEPTFEFHKDILEECEVMVWKR